MGSIWLTDLPAKLAGLSNVSYYSGWKTRSRSSGGYDALLGIACHHTASQTSTANDTYYQWVSSSLGPVGAIYLGRGGEIVVGAAGATNCVGKGGPRTFSRGTAPLDRGNQNTISIEAGNNGVGEPWPKVQQDQYVRLVRALCDGYGFKASDVFSHYEWTPGRKIDPAGPSRFGVINMNDTWNMDLFRKEVAGASPGPVPGTPPSKPPTTGATYTVNGYRLTVKQGSSGKMAKMCQQQINLISGPGIAEDGNFGSQSVGALKNLQAVLKVPADGVCGPQTWQAMETGIKNQADKGEWD